MPRQFIGVAASTVALAAAIALALTVGGQRQEIPAASPTQTQEQQAPGNPPQPQQPQQPAPQQPPEQQQPAPPAQETPAPQQTEPAPQPSEPGEPGEPAPQTTEPTTQPPTTQPPTTQPPTEPPTPAPARLETSVPNMPSLVADGTPVDMPLTVRNAGGTLSEPVVAVLNLPTGVSTVPIDGLAGRRLLSLDGAKAGTVNCPAAVGTVTCVSGIGLAPDETVTLLFRLVAADNAKGGKINGVVTAGTDVRTNFSLSLNVRPAPVTDGVTVEATSPRPGLLGWLWAGPVVDVTITNSGTSSRPVTMRVDHLAEIVRSTQNMPCVQDDGGTTCETTAELAPGEKLEIKLSLNLGEVPEEGSPTTTDVTISATLGSATDSVTVTVWNCFWQPQGTRPTHPGESTPSTPPSTSTPQPGTPPDQAEPTRPTDPTNPADPSESTDPSPPVTTTTPPTSEPPTEQEEQGRNDESTSTTETPPTSEPSSGILDGLLGWLLGG
jgi:hypothetical protein